MASYVDGETHGSVLQSEGLEFLLSRGGERVPLTVLEGKTTCLFFSANWCRPCRNFTPRLAQLYETLKSYGEKLEIVFVSFDRDESGFEEHLERMPWLAVPFDAGVRGRLCTRYRVERIPSLVPLASDERRVEEDAVQLVEDYGVEAFPFGVKRRVELEAMDEAKRHGGKLQDLVGRKGRDYVISRAGEQIPIADLVGNTVGLYFGAHWCPPCRTFTTMLTEAYNELKSSKNGSFEIIFISTDRDEAEFQSSLKEMPWLAIPYSDTTRHDLSRVFSIKVIPALVLLGPDGKALGTDGRAMITSHGAGAFPFTESRAAEVEAAMRKEGDGLARQVRDRRHEHVLKLDIANGYVCDGCARQGRYWVFSCDRCDFDLHPCCVEAAATNHGCA